MGKTWDSLIQVSLGHVGLEGLPSVTPGIAFLGTEVGFLGHVGFVGLLSMGIWDTWDSSNKLFLGHVGLKGTPSGAPL